MVDIWQLVWQKKEADKEILPLPFSSFSANAADAAPSSPPWAWLTEPAVAVLWLQTSPQLPSPPQPGWERGQVSARQDTLHQQPPWHSCRPGLRSAGVVWGCLDRRGAAGHVSSPLLEPAYLGGFGCGLVVHVWLYQQWLEPQTTDLSALGEEQCVPEQPQLNSGCWCVLKASRCLKLVTATLLSLCLWSIDYLIMSWSPTELNLSDHNNSLCLHVKQMFFSVCY